MAKIRIEIHLEEEDVKKLDKKAKKDGRSRKNFCETEILKVINTQKVKANNNNA